MKLSVPGIAPLAPLLISILCAVGYAQTSAVSRITQPIQDAQRVTLKGNVHPLAQARFDLGTVPDSFPAARMVLLLKRSPQQEAALQQFLEDAHTPGSPNFHKWLSPGEFAQRYGVSDSDISAVSGWLQKEGFSISRINRARTAIEFSGTAAQVRSAFRTQIHAYLVNGEEHHANQTDPQIPAALAPVVAGVTPINDFRPKSYITRSGKAVYDSSSKSFVPDWSFPANQPLLALSPDDFALQYDLGPLYASGVNGAGITIGIIGASNVDPAVVATYRSFFGLPANPLKVVIDGTDPGENYAAGESYLDVELAGSVARGATISLYTAADTTVQSGLYLAAIRAVDDDQATILSTSYGLCEQYLGSAGNQFWNSLWEQAAAQGQTSFVSSGDGGPAGCDDFNRAQPAQAGIAVNGIGSTPWNVSVGGTDFYYSSYNQGSTAQQTQLNTYWNPVTTLYPTTSLLQPVPEQAWNLPFGLNLASGGKYDPSSPAIVGGSGGPSSCATGTDATNGAYSSCAAGYSKPSWQAGSGVPNDGVRDLPDVSLFAAVAQNDSFYPFCTYQGECVVSDANLTIGVVGGTSASSPAMAGILALIEQKYGPQGQADSILYPLAAQHPSAFHDVTNGSNIVPCNQGSPNCALSSATDNTNGYYTLGFNAGPGYDLATGLGSVDANVLFKNWNAISFKSTSTSLSLSQTTFPHGTPIVVNVGVTGSGGTPTGSVALVTTSTAQDSKGAGALTLQGGTASATISSLPGGQYDVTARYSGDGIFSSSTSTPVSLSVTPEASKLSLSGMYYKYPQWNILTNGGSYPVGTPIEVEAQIAALNPPAGSTDGIATGTVTWTDTGAGATTSGPISVGSGSTAEWLPTGLSVGSHSLSAAYSGDASYNASASAGPLNFTITKATPFTQFFTNNGTNTITVQSGQTVMLRLIVGINVDPAPSGTVTFKSGTTVLGTAQVTPTTDTWPYINSKGTLDVTNLPLGTNSITAEYSGDANFEAATATPVQVTVTPAQAAATLTASAGGASQLPTQDLIVTSTVAGASGKPAPTGSIYYYAFGGANTWSAFCDLVNGSCSFDFSANYWSPGTVNIQVSYSGDTTYAPSSTTLQVKMLDVFTMTAAPSVSLAAGATTGNSSALTVTPANGFTGSIYFACTIAYYPPGAQHLPTCSVPTSVNVTSASAVTAAMTISSTGPTTTSSADGIPNPRRLGGQGIAVLACVFVIFPLRRRIHIKGAGLGLFLLLVASLGIMSCGSTGGSGSGGGGKTVPGTTAGTYKFLVYGAYTPNTRTPQPLFSTQPQVFVVDVTIQ